MPYINEEKRRLLKLGLPPSDVGELNYAITRVVLDFLKTSHQPMTYQDLNDAIGALESAKLELYRRIVVPYEQLKLEENGDLYDIKEDLDLIADLCGFSKRSDPTDSD